MFLKITRKKQMNYLSGIFIQLFIIQAVKSFNTLYTITMIFIIFAVFKIINLKLIMFFFLSSHRFSIWSHFQGIRCVVVSLLVVVSCLFQLFVVQYLMTLQMVECLVTFFPINVLYRLPEFNGKIGQYGEQFIWWKAAYFSKIFLDQN